MKTRLLILASLILLFSGCLKDDRLNFMVDDSFGLTAREAIVEASIHTGSFSVGIAKNGIGSSAASVEIISGADDDKAALDAYNKANGTSFKALPAYLYEFSDSKLEYSEKEVVKEVSISWDAKLVARMMDTGADYVIPLYIKSENLSVKKEHSFIMVHLNRSSIKLSQTGVNRTVEKKTVEPDKQGIQPPLQESVILDVVIDNVIKGMDITYPVVVDNSLIASFNESSEIQYTQAPQGLVTIDTPSVTISGGNRSATLKVSFDYSVLLQNGKLEEFPSYLIPVKLDKEALKAVYKEKDFPVEGLSYGNTVAYIAFNWRPTVIGLTVRREWGKYSSDAGEWSSYIEGFTGNSERNVTLDGDFIYLAEANTTKNLWAISLKDPGSYKKLPVGTVADAGTFYLACPRVVPNDNPDINGGKPVLVVSNMAIGNPALYIYSGGINANPSAIALETWASRRLGDTFTWYGSLQDGVIFFKDADSEQGTVTFWMKGKTAGTMYLVGRIAAPAVTGAGGYFPFPDNINAGFGSTRGGNASWYISTTKNLATLEGADNAPTIEEMDAAWANSAFRFFEFKGKRYVAVAKQDGGSAGVFVLLEGGLADSWRAVLESGNIVYQAAIQNDTENESLDETASSKVSGNSGMDLDVWQEEDDVYVAVVKQNVGLSLFHLSYAE